MIACFICGLPVFRKILVCESKDGFTTRDRIMMNKFYLTCVLVKSFAFFTSFLRKYVFTHSLIIGIIISMSRSTWFPPYNVQIEFTKLIYWNSFFSEAKMATLQRSVGSKYAIYLSVQCFCDFLVVETGAVTSVAFSVNLSSS